MIRVAVVEDQPLYRDMLTGLLGREAGMRVVASADGAAQARSLITPGSVDVALLDIELADGNGIGLGVSLRRSDPDLAIVLLSAQDAMELLLDLPADVRRGWSYLSKNSSTSAEVLLSTIRATLAGETVLDPRLVDGSVPRPGSTVDALSPRQFTILGLVARGHSNQGVADELGISPKSVENQLGTIYASLNLPRGHNTRVAAVLRFLEETARGVPA